MSKLFNQSGSLAAWYLFLSGICGTLMGVLVKLTEGASFIESTLVRSIMILAINAIIVSRSGGVSRYLGSRTHLPILLARGIFGCFGIMGFYYSLLKLPYSNAMAFHYLAPTLTAVLGTLLFKEKLRFAQIPGIMLVGFGVYNVNQLQALRIEDSLNYLIAFGGSISSAMAYNVIRKISTKESALTVMSYFSSVCIVVCVPLYFFDQGPSQIDSHDFFLLILSGLAGYLMQVTLTKGYALAKHASVSLVSYLSVIYAPIIGLLVFGESLSLAQIGGMFTIMLGLIFPHLFNHFVDRTKLRAKTA